MPRRHVGVKAGTVKSRATRRWDPAARTVRPAAEEPTTNEDAAPRRKRLAGVRQGRKVDDRKVDMDVTGTSK
jgi:hypothetical protein